MVECSKNKNGVALFLDWLPESALGTSIVLETINLSITQRSGGRHLGTDLGADLALEMLQGSIVIDFGTICVLFGTL